MHPQKHFAGVLLFLRRSLTPAASTYVPCSSQTQKPAPISKLCCALLAPLHLLKDYDVGSLHPCTYSKALLCALYTYLKALLCASCALAPAVMCPTWWAKLSSLHLFISSAVRSLHLRTYSKVLMCAPYTLALAVVCPVTWWANKLRNLSPF